MVKADASRNYYADLKVAPNAHENEIRKAFRSLALQYHPDRNPGHEAEFVVKFQEIQAAHEILCDPTQRLKYDNERKKYRNSNTPTNTPNTPRTRPPPPPRNAHTTSTPSGSYYRAPPPKPQPQPQRPPPQHYQTYNSGQDRFTNKNFRPPPTAQRPHSAQKDSQDRASVFTAWQKMKSGTRPEEPRPNPTNPNNPNGTPFGRSQSTRVPSVKTGFNPGTPGADEGPAKSGGYRSSYARPTATPPTPAETSSPNADAPFSEGNRVRTPYYSKAAGIREEGIGRSASMRNSPLHSHQPSPSNDAGSHSDSGRRQQRNSYGGSSTKHQFPQMYPDSSDESEAEVFRTSTGNRQRAPSKASHPPPPTWGQSSFATPPPKQSVPPSGNVPNSFKSRSEESINMKFSPSDWHGKFQGSADYFAPNAQASAANKGRQSPTRGRAASQRAAPSYPPPGNSFKTQFGYMPPPPPGPPPQPKFAPPPEAMPHNAKFSPEIWSETFKEPSWALPNDVSDRKNSETLKRPKPPRKPSVPKPQDQPDRSRPTYQATAEELTGEPEEMDIDSDTQPTKNANFSATRPKTAPSSPRKEKTRRTGSVPPKSAPSPALPSTSSAPGLNGLSGIATVEPFIPMSNGGLSELDALKNTLPFESRASTAHPTKPSSARTLKLPTLPAAPHAPLKLDQATTDAYFSHMESYVRAFHAFSKGITNHFASRSTELEDLDDKFIHIRGETTKKLGFASYLNRMKEDEAVMTTWKVAQERHIKALEQCEEVRNKTIKLYHIDMPVEDTSPMKHMRERLVEIVAGLSLRRSLSVATPKPVPASADASLRSNPYPHMRRNVSASA
ncbi:DnaJ domain-containing protein [Stagonosporopsis vannaccii]|nr:DnaJ domain-containing protein [Stagonosporopsis vannaccii]